MIKFIWLYLDFGLLFMNNKNDIIILKWLENGNTYLREN